MSDLPSTARSSSSRFYIFLKFVLVMWPNNYFFFVVTRLESDSSSSLYSFRFSLNNFKYIIRGYIYKRVEKKGSSRGCKSGTSRTRSGCCFVNVCGSRRKMMHHNQSFSDRSWRRKRARRSIKSTIYIYILYYCSPTHIVPLYRIK